MSDNKEVESFEEEPSLEIDESIMEEAREEKEVTTNPQRRRRSSAGFFSFLALLLAAGGIAAGYYLYENEIKPLKHLPDRVDQLRQTGASKEDVSTLQNQLQAVSAGNESLQSELANAGGEYLSIQAGLAELRKNAGWGQREWSLAEVAYLLNIASQELTIRRDSVTAVSALNGAVKRLDSLADPELGGLRREIMLDIQSVENYQQPDAEQVLAKLSEISAGLQPIPEAEMTFNKPDVTNEKPLRDKGLRDIWETFRSSLSSRVRVIKHEAPLNALAQQGVEAYKVDILQLRIDILRLALLRQDSDAFRRELSALARWAEQSLPVKQSDIILAEAGQLQQLTFAPLPELQADVSRYLNTNTSKATTAAEPAPEAIIPPADDASITPPSGEQTPVEESSTQQAGDAVQEAGTEAVEIAPEASSYEQELSAPPLEEADSLPAAVAPAAVAPADHEQESAGTMDNTTTSDTETVEEVIPGSEQPSSNMPAEVKELDKLLQQLDFEQPEGAAE